MAETRSVVRVVLPDFLQAHTGQGRELEVVAESFSELVARFERDWPGSAELIAKKATTVIDGEIVPVPDYDALRDGSEVCFLPKLSAG